MAEINTTNSTTEQTNPKSGKSNIEVPMEVPVHEREEREALDRAFASNDKLQFDNLIAQANARNNNVIDKDRLLSANEKVQFDNAIALANTRNNNSVDHANNTAKYAELALAEAVKFQGQMNGEYLRDVGQERSHADDKHHLSVHGFQNLQEHNDIRYHHSIDNDRKTLSHLYDLEIPEAAANAMVIKAVEDTITKMKAAGKI